MSNHNFSLVRFRDINTRHAKNQFLAFLVVLVVFPPCIFQVPLGLASDAQGKSDISGLVVWKSPTQDRRNAVRFLNGTQVAEGINEDRLEGETLGIPSGGESVFLGSRSTESVTDEPVNEHSQERPGQKANRKDAEFNWHRYLRIYLIGLAIGLLVSF